jgi:hypothetical protein
MVGVGLNASGALVRAGSLSARSVDLAGRRAESGRKPPTSRLQAASTGRISVRGAVRIAALKLIAPLHPKAPLSLTGKPRGVYASANSLTIEHLFYIIVRQLDSLPKECCPRVAAS